jgi:hypothetical protein
MATIAIQDGKIVLKDDKVSCTCCGPCSGGCSTILGALPSTGNPPVKPTSMAWSASFSISIVNPDCGDNSNLFGTIDQQSDGCSAGVGYVFVCYTQYNCENNECLGNYGSSVAATIVIGKYKVETVTDTSSPCGPFEINTLVPDTSPEAECAYWLVLSGGEVYGAFGWSISSPNLSPIPPDQIIGSHEISCTVYAGTFEYDPETDDPICDYSTSLTRSATITFA